MFHFWIPFAQNVDYGKYRKRIFRLKKKKKRKWCHFYYFYLASFHKIIVPTNCSQRTTLKLQSRVVDNRFSIRIRNSVPIESARIAFKHRPWNNLFPTSHAHWIRDSTRRFNSKKKKSKKKKKTLLARRKRVGVTITPTKNVYRYTYTYKTHRTMESVVRSYLYDVGRKETTVGLPCCAQRNVKILPRASDLNDAAGISTRSKSYACVIG